MTEKQTDDWPSHTQELSRKATEVLASWIERHARGGCTDRDLFIVTEVLSSAITGLAEWPVVDLIEAVNKEIRASVRAKRKG